MGFRYARQYMELIGQTDEDFERKQRIDEIKKKFTSSNSFVDIRANSKPFIPNILINNNRPLVDNEH